jgi:hypothetical protein
MQSAFFRLKVYSCRFPISETIRQCAVITSESRYNRGQIHSTRPVSGSPFQVDGSARCVWSFGFFLASLFWGIRGFRRYTGWLAFCSVASRQADQEILPQVRVASPRICLVREMITVDKALLDSNNRSSRQFPSRLRATSPAGLTLSCFRSPFPGIALALQNRSNDAWRSPH